MIEIQLNDETVMLKENTALSCFLLGKPYLDAGFAVAINHHFIPRSLYETTYLQAGDSVMVVAPMAGG